MMRRALGRVVDFVTEHNVLVVVLALVVSAGVVAGISHLQTESEAAGDTTGDTEVAQKQQYIQTHYGDQAVDDGPTTRVVYVRDEDGNVLSKAALLEALRFQRDALADDAVASVTADERPTVGVANYVATAAAGDRSASLDEQIAALEATDREELRALVERTLTADSPALQLLPNEYEPGTAEAESSRMVFRFAGSTDTEGTPFTDAQRVLYEQAADRSNPEFFTLGEHAQNVYNDQAMENVTTLILPVALAVILAVLAFAYRDLVDILVGFTGVVLSVLWMFGILGWLGVSAGSTFVIGPVLIVGLSVDYGLHVFMRYREERGDGEDIREPMTRSLSSVAVALGLVTVTTAIGFLSNAANDVTVVRNLAVGITLGVVSAFVLFVTFVPALKVTIDRLLERIGLDRRKQPLGKSGALESLLASGATLARRAAPVVIVVAVVLGSVGAVAWTQLDKQAYQSQTDEAADWKQNLPEPLAWEVPEPRTNYDYVAAHYRSVDESDRVVSYLLVEGEVTDDAALASLQTAKSDLADSEAVFSRGDGVPYQSPVSVMQSVAAQDDEFAGVLADADTDGDGVPDRNVDAVYDALYATAPDAASRVVERRDGEYQSLRVIVPIDATATADTRNDAMRAAESVVDESDGVSATAVGRATVTTAELAQIASSILRTLVVALVAVSALLVVIYRVSEGSATLGAVTAFPVALVTALVIGGMYVLNVPLTLLTALLLSLVVGLGIDYSIHVTDRFVHELRAGKDTTPALREALTGTGGALLGSTLTSTGAFSALLLHPHPQFQSFGTLVVLALGLSFVVSVVVLPSLLYEWSKRVRDAPAGSA
ncbi:efflux RND transporter permease subunit [Halobacterium wangiae]|uniref:efflux RND transporter permease subunit n=1 Tax=Halobacterium wangiae TaxID=2902623 RepID=UPI001E42AF19|nr:MMPL family transporter [Halobacterium wangiae]